VVGGAIARFAGWLPAITTFALKVGCVAPTTDVCEVAFVTAERISDTF
jgi:hypothetical protein